MNDNEEELNKPLTRILRISIVNPLPPKVDLSKRILEKSYEYKERLKFTLLASIKDLYKPKKILSEIKLTKGLIDKQWLEDITQERPCLIILYYHIDEKNKNLELEQQKIYSMLEEIKKNDSIVPIFLFIIFRDNPESPYPLALYSHSNAFKGIGIMKIGIDLGTTNTVAGWMNIYGNISNFLIFAQM